MTQNRYGKARELPDFIRPGLLPGILGMIVLLVGINAVEQDWRIWILYLSTIFALINVVYAVQAKSWFWLVPLVAIVVIWNPAFMIDLPENFEILVTVHLVGALIFAISGFLIKVPTKK